MEHKKGQRWLPRGKTKIAVVPVHGMRLEDVDLVLHNLAETRTGNPRTYLDAEGNLVVAVLDHTA
jgi:hypothetical protein